MKNLVSQISSNYERAIKLDESIETGEITNEQIRELIVETIEATRILNQMLATSEKLQNVLFSEEFLNIK